MPKIANIKVCNTKYTRAPITSTSNGLYHLYFSKVLGYFTVGSALYFAYQTSNNTTMWYRASDLQTGVDVEPSQAFYKSDMAGIP